VSARRIGPATPSSTAGPGRRLEEHSAGMATAGGRYRGCRSASCVATAAPTSRKGIRAYDQVPVHREEPPPYRLFGWTSDRPRAARDRGGNVQPWGIIGVQKAILAWARSIVIEEIVDGSPQPGAVVLPGWQSARSARCLRSLPVVRARLPARATTSTRPGTPSAATANRSRRGSTGTCARRRTSRASQEPRSAA
jgi:hypothetical protein